MKDRLRELRWRYPSQFNLESPATYSIAEWATFTRYSGESFRFSEWERSSPADIAKGNMRIKYYPDGSQDILVCDRPIFKSAELVSRGERKNDTLRADGSAVDELLWEAMYERFESADSVDMPIGFDDSARRNKPASLISIRRAQARLKELLRSNSFQYFVTITLDKAKVDRYDYGTIIKPLNKWLDNRVQRKGYKYILVPELHKDGAIHFHGLISGDMELSDSGTVKVHGHKKPVSMATYKRHYKGRPYSTIYNATDWRYGFTTVVKLRRTISAADGAAVQYNSAAVANYISKYITKDSVKVGGRWYLSGGTLDRPRTAVKACDFAAVADVCRTFGIEGRRERFCAFRVAATGEMFYTAAVT